MRYNIWIPVQMYVEDGPCDDDGEPLSRPLGQSHIHLHVEAENMGDAMSQVQRTMQHNIDKER